MSCAGGANDAAHENGNHDEYSIALTVRIDRPTNQSSSSTVV